MRLNRRVGFFVAFATLVFAAAALPQQAKQGQTPESGKEPAAASRIATYVLGPGDEIMIVAIDADEISKQPFPIGTTGDISLPLVGRVHAAGMTVEQFEKELTDRLKVIIKDPQLGVNVTKFKSQPVSVIGAVATPGVIQLEGRKALYEVLSMAGGTRPDAGYRVQITRKSEWGPIPLPSAVSISNEYSVAEVNIRNIMNASHPEENIQIFPYDVISVPKADLVYVMGEVRKPGGFVLNDKENISVLQALALAEGMQPTASKKNGKILRPVPGANRVEIAINLQDVLSGKAKDQTLQPEDILFVPDSYAKGTFRRTLESSIQMVTGMAIYRR
jgi:polysaccharide export outer membrane protein